LGARLGINGVADFNGAGLEVCGGKLAEGFDGGE